MTMFARIELPLDADSMNAARRACAIHMVGQSSNVKPWLNTGPTQLDHA
jgi:hypothetical protein